MKSKFAIKVICLTSCALISIESLAQDLAPPSVAAQLFSVTTLTGGPPFSSGGDYKLFTSPLGSNFVLLGKAEPGLNWGSYSYTVTGTNGGTVALVDAQSGIHATLSLLYNSAAGGQMSLTNPGTAGFQTATFLASNYTALAPAQLFLPSYSNQTFRAYLSGQIGGAYALDVSSNLQNWLPLASLTLTNLTSPLVDTNQGNIRARFYRARVTSLNFAPNSINGQSLCFAAMEGVAPFSSNGFSQFIADASDNGYSMFSGPGFTNTAGTFAYSNMVPGGGLVTFVDSESVVHSASLFYTGPGSGFYYETNATSDGYQAGSFNMEAGPVVYLGKYNYTPDTSRSASVYFAAAGNPAFLSVTDAVGNLWSLTLPADALASPQTITMTPAANVDSSSAALPAAAAVLLEPDGLQFCDGVTLTLTTPEPLGTNAILMVTAGDGSDVNLVATTTQLNTYTTTLFHFSSGAATSPSNQQLQGLASAVAMIRQAFNQALSQAQNLEANVQQPPPPPEYDWPCDPEVQALAAQEINAYYTSLFSQEMQVIQSLANADQAMLKLEDSSLTTPAGSAIAQLFQKDIFVKLNFLVNEYGPYPESLYAVSIVTLAMTKQAAYFETPTPPTLLPNLYNDFNIVGNYYLGQLRNDHDYSAIHSITSVAKEMQLLGGDSSSLLASLGQALTFQLTLDIYANAVASGPESSDTITLEANGTFQLTFGESAIQGSGTCNYLSGQNILEINGENKLSVSIAPGQTFPETCTVNIQSCPDDFTETATFTFSAFGSPTETWDFPNGQQMVADLLGITGVCFASFQTSQGITISMPLQDGNAQAVNSSITEPGSIPGQTETSTLQVTLQHTPQ
jgi:hypothetical protein